MTQTAIVTGSFDNLGSKHIRFLEEASKFGKLVVALWSDETVRALEGRLPKFPEREREYLVGSLRFVDHVTLVRGTTERETLPELGTSGPAVWVVGAAADTPAKRVHAQSLGLDYHVLRDSDLEGFPVPPFSPPAPDSGTKRAIVTGCFDWFHSGHVRFFEQVAALGDLYVVVGHDANLRLLKGDGHPLFPQEERLYCVYAVRSVHQALLSTGHGWMDAALEVDLIRPHFYVVNEDGDKPEKKAFCREHGIEYVVLSRVPKPGLPRRQSTDLRGF